MVYHHIRWLSVTYQIRLHTLPEGKRQQPGGADKATAAVGYRAGGYIIGQGYSIAARRGGQGHESGDCTVKAVEPEKACRESSIAGRTGGGLAVYKTGGGELSPPPSCYFIR